MLFHRTLAALLILSGSATAFSPKSNPWGGKKILKDVNKNLSTGLVAGVIAATTFIPFTNPAVAEDSLVFGSPLEAKLAKFGVVSYPVFNSISDVSPLADKFIEFTNNKIKAPDSADVAQKAVDGLLAIPDAKVNEYSGILKQVVYSGVKADSCVTLGGSGKAAAKLAQTDAIKSVDSSKIDALKTKFKPANSAVPTKGGDICLPGSVAGSEKLWVAQAELTLSMPKEKAAPLVASIKKAGAQIPRSSILSLVPTAENVFSKSPEAIEMVAAGKDVEPTVISTVNAALK